MALQRRDTLQNQLDSPGNRGNGPVSIGCGTAAAKDRIVPACM